ncbi:MAG: hypothetical protein KF778_21665 [Rhodocyclaceae bacterium]|nr:hypothetical protein [Rhodocyclaceae bacterium]
MDTPTPIQTPDASRHDATSPDLSRQVATALDDYVSLKEAREIFLAHGRPVSERTLQRSCVKGHIAGKKIATGEGEKWFALKSSVLTRIAELDKFDDLRERHDATSRDASRQVAEEKQGDDQSDTTRQASSADVAQPVVAAQPSQSTTPDLSRHDATGRDASAELERIDALYKKIITMTEAQIEDLRRDKEILQADKAALIGQLVTKDKQIERFFSSERDTKTLFGTLQTLVASILPGRSSGDRYVPERDALGSGLPENQPDER